MPNNTFRHFFLPLLKRTFALAGLSLSFALGMTEVHAAEIPFSDVELPTKLGVGYAVQLLDMNGDQRLDICIVDQERILWLENPTWKEHILIEKQTKKDNVCFTSHDIDGDGRLDFAVGADWRPFDTQTGGTIQWISGAGTVTPTDLWKVLPISEIPTVHRMNFGDILGNKRPELVVVPLMGRGTTKPNFAEAPVEVSVYSIPANPLTDPWPKTIISNQLHVCHNFVITDFNRDGHTDVLVVAFEGIYLLERPASGTLWKHTRIGSGNQKQSPNRGASEIKTGHLKGNSPYIATIEPWHGNEVVVYTKPNTPPTSDEWLWDRHLLDDQLKWGHAVACVNLDDDEEQELVIGVRDTLSPENPCGVRIYDPVDAAAGKWQRQMLDPGSVAVEDLAVGDLNGDGQADIVAVGRATHNVKIYFHGTKR